MMAKRITEEIRQLCGVSCFDRYNDFGEFSILRGRVAEACDKVDAEFEVNRQALKERRICAAKLRNTEIIGGGMGLYPFSSSMSICGCQLIGHTEADIRNALEFLALMIEPEPE